MDRNNLNNGELYQKKIILRGNVETKEKGLPLPDLLINAYTINISLLRDKHWYDFSETSNIFQKAGECISSINGEFEIIIDSDAKVDENIGVGFIVMPIEGRGKKYDLSDALYVSPAVFSLSIYRLFRLQIPMAKLENVGYTLEVKPAFTERLEQERLKAKELEDLIKKKDKQFSIESKRIISKINRVFKNFRPTSLSNEIRKSDNYIDINDVTQEKQKKIYIKAFSKIQKTNSENLRIIRISNELIEKLKLKENEPKILSSTEKDQMLNYNIVLEDSIGNALESSRITTEQESMVIETLFNHFNKIKNQNDKNIEK